MARFVTIIVVVLGLGGGAVFGVLEFNERWYLDGLRPVPRADRGASSTDPATFASADRSDPLVSDGAIVDTQASDTTGGMAADSTSPGAAPETQATVAAMPSDTGASETTPATTPATPPAVTPATPIRTTVLAPMIDEGRTEFGDSVYAVREGGTVTVHFDTFLTRTRRRDKFDRIVRETLPRVYGAPADSLLAAVPVGQIAQGGDLVGELATSGISLELADGSTLALLPRTRPGRDGPLVVAYQATVRP
jgi:hypothetical protein